MGPASVWEGERVLARACRERAQPSAARLKLVKMAAVAAYTSQRKNSF